MGARVTLFFDECVQKSVARALFTADIPCEVQRYTEWAARCGLTEKRDDSWLPIVGSNGWVLITKDLAIATNEVELQAYRDNGVCGFAFGGSLTTWELLLAFCRSWRRMNKIIETHPAPFFYEVRASGQFKRWI
jgi:hypothetical protein